MKHPSKKECLALLKDYNTPSHVIGHCVAVADVALHIGKALNDQGYSLNLELIQGAALIHDIARVEDKHWEVGSQIAADLGYAREAEIIQVHMRYTLASSASQLTETDIVCLADRVVLEDRYVGLDRRMDYVIAKAKAQGHEDAIPHILKRKKETHSFIQDIEKTIKLSLSELMER